MFRRTIAAVSALGVVVGVSVGLLANASPAAGRSTAGSSVTGPSQTVGHAVFLGTAPPAVAASGAGFVDRPTDAVAPDTANHPSAARASSLRPPSPRGTPVSASAGGAKGFAGLTHRDQRLAGTGRYRNTQFSLEPPDQALCVGNGFVLEGVNDAFAVFSPAGARLTAATAYNQFFDRSPGVIRSTPPVFGDFLSDPKCYFDPVSSRFFQTILEIDAPGNVDGSDRTHVLVAVSATSDPTGAWNLFSFDTSDDGNFGTPAHTGCPCLPDQPLLGANGDGLFISTNEFQLLPGNFPFNGAQIYAFSRTALETASSGSTPAFVHLDVGTVPTGDPNLPFWGSIQPSTSPHPSHGRELLMSGGPEDIFQNNAPVDNRIAVWSLAGTASLNTATPALMLSHTVLTSEVYGLPINFGANQRSGPTPLRDALGGTDPLERLNANDSRMNQVTFADGKLYGAVNTTVTSPGNPDRVGIAFFVVAAETDNNRDTRVHVSNQGYVAADGQNVLFPSIGVNADGNGAMALTLAGPGFFPSAAFVRFNASGAHGPIHITGAGVGPEDGFTGYAAFAGNGVARWGDYSAAVATPDGTIWMANEYIPGGPRTLLANWGTFISHVSTTD
jgi:hypothetical protein